MFYRGAHKGVRWDKGLGSSQRRTCKKSGLLDRALASLTEAGLRYVELDGDVPNPRLSLVRKGIELCRNEGVDFNLAVGGGSVIDSSKAIAMGTPYEGDVWEFFVEDKGVVHDIPRVRITNSDGTVGGLKRLCAQDIVNIFKLAKQEALDAQKISIDVGEGHMPGNINGNSSVRPLLCRRRFSGGIYGT